MLKTKEIQAVITSANIGADIKDSNLNVVIGEAAKLETQQAVNYIKSGQAEIAEAVSTGERAFNANAEQKTAEFNNNATAQTGDFNTNATNKTTDFNDNYVAKKALIDAEVAVAEGYSAEAKQWAVGDPSEPVGNSSEYWARQSAAAAATVNDATLTVQKNGSSVGTFTANSSTDTTINITVPTAAADVGALPNSTKYGASLSLTVNSSTFVVTAQLKDQDGNNLGVAQTIDLPLESVVVSGSYDNANKKIVLTLQNGTTVDVPVADLVAGLQAEITASNKLSADLVDDTSTTNKFVTTSEKSTWNGKQDAIADLTTIRNGASAGATAVQPAALATVATSGAYADLSGTPTIPTVNNPTITITQGGTTKGSFSLNQSANASIDLDSGGSSTITYDATTKTLTWS